MGQAGCAGTGVIRQKVQDVLGMALYFVRQGSFPGGFPLGSSPLVDLM